MKIGKYVSSFLTADDVVTPVLVTITDVVEEKVGNDFKLVLYGDGLDGVGISLNKSNLKRLAEICGSEETDDWNGNVVVVYRDPNVMFAGKKVGGIAFRVPKPGFVAPAATEKAVDNRAEDSVPF